MAEELDALAWKIDITAHILSGCNTVLCKDILLSTAQRLDHLLPCPTATYGTLATYINIVKSNNQNQEPELGRDTNLRTGRRMTEIDAREEKKKKHPILYANPRAKVN